MANEDASERCGYHLDQSIPCGICDHPDPHPEGFERVPESVEDQRLRRYGPTVMGVDIASQPGAIIFDPPYGMKPLGTAAAIGGNGALATVSTDSRLDHFYERFIDSIREATNLPYEEFVKRCDAPYLREADDALTTKKLSRARRLINRAVRATERGAAQRKLKRARRLHREVYGPFYSGSRFSMLVAHATLVRSFENMTKAVLAAARTFAFMGRTLEGLKLPRPLILSDDWADPRSVDLIMSVDELRTRRVPISVMAPRPRRFPTIRISDVDRFTARDLDPVSFYRGPLGEVYQGKKAGPFAADVNCPECGLSYEECNRRAQLRRDGERFRRWNRQVVIPLQEKAALRRRTPPLSNLELLQGMARRLHRNLPQSVVSVCRGPGTISSTFRLTPRDRFRRFEARVKEIQEQAAITRAIQDAIADGVVRGVEIDTFNALFPDDGEEE